MNSKTLVTVIAVALLVGGGVYAWLHHSHENHTDHEAHAAHAHDTAAPPLVNGQRWETDEALRTSMLQIRDAASQQQGAALASTTKAQVDYMITHCKLDSQADAAFHDIISQLLTGADMLNKAPDSPDGVERIQHALQQYPDYFNHPDFLVNEAVAK